MLSSQNVLALTVYMALFIIEMKINSQCLFRMHYDKSMFYLLKDKSIQRSRHPVKEPTGQPIDPSPQDKSFNFGGGNPGFTL